MHTNTDTLFLDFPENFRKIGKMCICALLEVQEWQSANTAHCRSRFLISWRKEEIGHQKISGLSDCEPIH